MNAVLNLAGLVLITLLIGSLVVNPLWFLSCSARYTMLMGRLDKERLVGMTTPFTRPLMLVAIDRNARHELSANERHRVSVLLWSIRAFFALAWVFIVITPLVVNGV